MRVSEGRAEGTRGVASLAVKESECDWRGASRQPRLLARRSIVWVERAAANGSQGTARVLDSHCPAQRSRTRNDCATPYGPRTGRHSPCWAKLGEEPSEAGGKAERWRLLELLAARRSDVRVSLTVRRA